MTEPEAFVLAIVAGGGLWAVRPLLVALAKRVAGETARAPAPDELAALRVALLDELHQVRQDVGELAERVDFTERLLAKQREGQRIGPE